MNDERAALFDLLYNKAFLYRDDPPFKLASGKESPYYFNCKAATLDPMGCYLVGKLIYEQIRDLELDGIGGLTLGADPISLSTSLESYRNGKNIKPLIIRKEAKQHGTQKWIEGNLDGVKRVIAIDDVITTGGSTIKAIERMRESGLDVFQAIVIIDRQEGGRENIEKLNVPVFSLFKREEFDARRLKDKS